MASTTVAFLFAGGMGALVNCYVSCTNLAILLGVQEAVVQPARTLLTALSGFLCGTLVLLVWYFLKNRVVRFLLDYNGWFLRSKSKIQSIMNKVGTRCVYIHHLKTEPLRSCFRFFFVDM